MHAVGSEPLRQVPLRLQDAWSGQVGGVDLALDDGEGSLTLIELKWDPNTLAACAWDSMKLAALQAGQGPARVPGRRISEPKASRQGQ
jgi:hypothetical protein